MSDTKRPNIIFYFSDQQRFDTLNPELMPNVWELAGDGVLFENSFTCQPVCGPARACLQTGEYATGCGCYWNGIALPDNKKHLADIFNENGYDTAYIGKWHLASDRYPKVGLHCEKTAVPKERRGGYKYWRAADVLEFTSHGYDGYVFDGDGNKLDFKGYRADCINDFAIEYIENRDREKPFFMFVSQLEPHHQNDHGHFEGPRETVEKFKSYPIPEDLTAFNGNYSEEYPDYIAAINRLDDNVRRLVECLKRTGDYENTVIIYTSDHGCHFKTRNLEYKRSPHDSATHTPLVIGGGGFDKKGVEKRLVSLIDLPPTLLEIAGIDIPSQFKGISLISQLEKNIERDCVFIQISESQVGRAIRTNRYLYSVRSLGQGYICHSARVYYEDYLYDLENDPNQLNNLVKDENYAAVRAKLCALLKEQMVNAGEKAPEIRPAKFVRRK